MALIIICNILSWWYFCEIKGIIGENVSEEFDTTVKNDFLSCFYKVVFVDTDFYTILYK